MIRVRVRVAIRVRVRDEYPLELKIFFNNFFSVGHRDLEVGSISTNVAMPDPLVPPPSFYDLWKG